jgi:branched-chain amino acid transport system permease protein
MAQQGANIKIMRLQWSAIIVLMTLMGGGFVSFWGPVLGVILYSSPATSSAPTRAGCSGSA